VGKGEMQVSELKRSSLSTLEVFECSYAGIRALRFWI
jgi:hypothetical protein